MPRESRGFKMTIQDQHGMGLIEVIVAILLLGIATIPLLNFFVHGNTFTATARHEVTALNLAQEIMEEIKSTPFRTIFGTIAEGSARGGTSNTIELDNKASKTNSLYKGCIITITDGTGYGQFKTISSYVYSKDTGAHTAMVESWSPNPDSTSKYRIEGPVFKGFAQGGASNNIILCAGAISKDDFYNDYYIEITSGTGNGQVKKITGYTGSTKVATVEGTWNPIPNASSFYQLNGKKVDQYKYKIYINETLDSADENLRKVKVTIKYIQGSTEKEVSLTTEKLGR